MDDATMTIPLAAEPASAARVSASPRPARQTSFYAYAVAASLFIIASAAVRNRQELRLDQAARAATESPIRLQQLPLRLATWKATGETFSFDEQTIQIAGCSDYMTRRYVDERTGVSLLAFVAFGPAEKIVGHTPLVCFPAAGYTLEAGPQDSAFATKEGSGRFRSAIYVRPAENAGRVEVSYAFRHAGRWSPDAAETRKKMRHQPAMFKIQLERRVATGERFGQDDPSQQFLTALVAELERSLAASNHETDSSHTSSHPIGRTGGHRVANLTAGADVAEKPSPGAADQLPAATYKQEYTAQSQDQDQRGRDQQHQQDPYRSPQPVRPADGGYSLSPTKRRVDEHKGLLLVKTVSQERNMMHNSCLGLAFIRLASSRSL